MSMRGVIWTIALGAGIFFLPNQHSFPQNRVTDHRINLNLYNLEKIMLGEIDELIEAMTNYGKEEKMKELAATL